MTEISDDHGVRRTEIGGIHGDQRVYINGCLKTFSEIYETMAVKTTKKVNEEGVERYKTNTDLYVNSIDKDTGKIVQAKVLRIYRLKPRKRMVRVGLANGLQIEIASSQKLSTRRGWER